VDDEPFNVVIIDSLLKNLGINSVDAAYNGGEALAKVLSNFKVPEHCPNHVPYKYVFMDYNMPIMNGVEAAK